MEKAFNDIHHRGIIRSVEGNNLKIQIEIQDECKACSVKASCSLSNENEKLVFVKDRHSNFTKGEEVDLIYHPSLAIKSSLLVYVFPIVFGFLTMLLINQFLQNELYSGLGMMLSVLFYFILLKGFEKRISKTFSFTVEKLSKISNAEI